MSKLLNTNNKLFTPASATTLYVDYSESKKTLEIQFTGGNIYHYYQVSAFTWKKLKAEITSGGSAGQFVNTEIKPKYTQFKQIA